MITDIRSKTAIVIEKNGAFLMGFSFFLRWTNSPYDAWRTRNRYDAQMVAERINGNMMLFNPIVGQIRKMGEDKCLK